MCAPRKKLIIELSGQSKFLIKRLFRHCEEGKARRSNLTLRNVGLLRPLAIARDSQ